jgi:tetratricopeptide (TPR) repeat protein
MRLQLVFFVGVLLLIGQTWQQDATKLFESGKYREAAAILEGRVREDPKDPAAHMLLGLCRQQLGAYAEADASFGAVIEIEPKAARAHYARARVRYFMGRFEDALRLAAEAEKFGEPAARVYNLRGRIEEERGNFEIAVREYGRALAADTKMSQAWSGLASALYKLGTYEEARTSATAALRLDPSDADAKRVLARVMKTTPAKADVGAEPAAPRLTRVEGAIDFHLEHFPTPEKHLVSTMTGGLAAFDYDNDGRLDLFFANGAELPSLKKTGPRFWNRLYRNRGNYQFEDVTEQQRLQGEGFAMGAAAADFDGDGRVDLFVPGVGRNLLYRNTAGGFVEVAKVAGVRDERWSVAAAWLDYDRDGKLDLFVVNYLDWTPDTNRYCGNKSAGLRVYCHPREYGGLPNRLYRNRGDGTFQDVSERSGIGKHIGKGMSAAVADFDGDGWPDIFVTNDSVPNFLFRNRGDGTFEEAALRLGAAFNESGHAISSMGVDARDFDNDGRPDLIVTALAGENFLMLQNGASGFTDVTFPSRLGLATARRSGWGVAFADLNNDGWKDLVSANSHVTDNIEQVRSERYREPNTVFVNRNGAFAAGAQEFGPAAAHRALIVGDLDNDGRLDVVVTVLGDRPEVWKNETAGGNWLRVRLEGSAIGARVQVGTQWQERGSAVGYGSSNLDAVHFGLGADTMAPEVRVIWPSGKQELLKEVKSGQTVTVREP